MKRLQIKAQYVGAPSKVSMPIVTVMKLYNIDSMYDVFGFVFRVIAAPIGEPSKLSTNIRMKTRFTSKVFNPTVSDRKITERLVTAAAAVNRGVFNARRKGI